MFSKDQRSTLSVLTNTSRNVFITGGAGTGKSYLLNHYISSKKNVVVLSSTGVSAMIIGGRTFHSFFGLGMAVGDLETLIRKSVNNVYVRNRILSAEEIVIDEISMIPGRLFFAADMICRRIFNKDIAFGGIRVVVCGDFLQLPPVTKGGETDWCFKVPSWSDLDLLNCYMREVLRTGDFSFSDVLNKIRVGLYDMEVYSLLKDRIVDPSFSVDNFDGTVLLPFRKSVSNLNEKKLDAIDSELVIYKTSYSGDETYRSSVFNSMPIEPELRLKKNALVMFRKNSQDGRYCNGTLGHVVDFSDHTIEVETDLGVVEVCKHKFDYISGSGKILATVSNFPLSLAYATTIHKSQGATLDSVCIDLRGVWEDGQTYVALSRVKNKQGLNVVAWEEGAIKASFEAVGFYETMENFLNCG